MTGASAYSVVPIVDGFPGKSASHGAFGWSSVYLLLGHGRVVLVETGPPAYIPLLSAGLARQGLEPVDVTDVLLTHAHWDHVSNIMMFPHARVWMGERELSWARSLPGDAPFMSRLHIDELHDRGDAVGRVTDGDEILPGVTVLATPGHTPGHVGYAVESTPQPVVFAGDAVKNLYEITTFDVDSTLDAQASRASIERLREHMRTTGAILVPGHDVPLTLSADTFARTRQQTADICFFATADGGAQDRSITDGGT